MSSNTTNTHASAHSGADTVNALKSGAAGLHGIGETIRGNFNQAVDTAFNDKAGEAKNQAIANKGLNEIEDGKYRGHGTGVNTAGTTTGTTAGMTTGTTAGTIMGHSGTTNSGLGTTGSTTGTTPGLGSSNYGSHGTNVGNKLDPTVDSDLDHRGMTTTTGQSSVASTNTGPHSSNLLNKLDPRVPSVGNTGKGTGTGTGTY